MPITFLQMYLVIGLMSCASLALDVGRTGPSTGQEYGWTDFLVIIAMWPAVLYLLARN
jgi:hypothetical protein